MTTRCAFVGDELSAAGYRLGGAECHTPALAEVPGLVRRLRADGGVHLLLLTAEYASVLPASELAEALATQRPPMLVVADIRGRIPPEDITAALKKQLGLAE